MITSSGYGRHRGYWWDGGWNGKMTEIDASTYFSQLNCGVGNS